MNDTNSLAQILAQIQALHGQPPVAVGYTIWHLLAATGIGAGIWHVILGIPPWAKQKGGLVRGILYFFWTPQPKSLNLNLQHPADLDNPITAQTKQPETASPKLNP